MFIKLDTPSTIALEGSDGTKFTLENFVGTIDLAGNGYVAPSDSDATPASNNNFDLDDSTVFSFKRDEEDMLMEAELDTIEKQELEAVARAELEVAGGAAKDFINMAVDIVNKSFAKGLRESTKEATKKYKRMVQPQKSLAAVGLTYDHAEEDSTTKSLYDKSMEGSEGSKEESANKSVDHKSTEGSEEEPQNLMATPPGSATENAPKATGLTTTGKCDNASINPSAPPPKATEEEEMCPLTKAQIAAEIATEEEKAAAEKVESFRLPHIVLRQLLSYRMASDNEVTMKFVEMIEDAKDELMEANKQTIETFADACTDYRNAIHDQWQKSCKKIIADRKLEKARSRESLAINPY
ncbi:MAG: hypothetical protein SGILL_007989 [Bacillariaceae sp.]